jgi:hypothetical protein
MLQRKEVSEDLAPVRLNVCSTICVRVTGFLAKEPLIGD